MLGRRGLRNMNVATHSGARFALALAARKIDQVETADTNVVLAIDAWRRALDRNEEDGVRARAALVHVRRAARQLHVSVQVEYYTNSE